MKLNPNLPNYLTYRTVTNIVEMTDTESFMLWCKYKDDNIYKTDNSGCAINVGFVNDDQSMPVFISVQFTTYKGKDFLQWEATSRFVDYTLIQEWFDLHYPNVNHTNTQNIHNLK